MVTAAPQDQWRLLDMQALDTALDQIAHRRRALPELAELTELTTKARTADDELVAANTVVQDIGRELIKAEADVEQVRQRAARDQARLDAGQGSAKDLQAMQHELGTLARRQAELEDVELEVMERHEAAQARQAAAKAAVADVAARTEAATARRDAALTDLDRQQTERSTERGGIATALPAELVALYQKVRDKNGGSGAAKLQQRRCGGCRLELTATDLAAARSAAEDAVLRCEECGCILVRTAESGL